MTDLPLLVLPPAEQDIVAAATDYDTRLIGLGSRFVSHVIQTLERIQRHPHSFQRFEGECRRAVVSRFPYAVVYRVLADRTEVIAVFPCRMNPGRLAHRLGASPE